MFKKLCAFSVLVLISVIALCGCSFSFGAWKSMRKKMVEYKEFNGESSYSAQTVHLVFNNTKTYNIYYKLEDEDNPVEFELNEKSYSHVVTFTNKYTVEHGVTGLIKTTETIKYSVYKLDGYIGRHGAYKDKQAYFIFKGDYGDIYFTNEEVTKEHFNQYKKDNGYISYSPTISVQPRSFTNGKW